MIYPVTLTHIEKIVERTRQPVYVLGQSDPVDYVTGPTSHIYKIEFDSVVELDSGQPITIENGVVKPATENDELFGRVVESSCNAISGGRTTTTATVQFTNNPDHDYEADRILKKPW